ncbi:MAG TPA: class I SAM-dependent methyltransferase [Thermomicrobiales bacterium]|nr:class I SAM-dependent methyltransferase [Thermomicrobiales bacterium]
MDSARAKARQLLAASLERGDPVGWFEPLYAEANGDAAAIQWADLRPNPHLTAWLNRAAAAGAGRRALVVGCGLGDDAEELARRGFAVVAFDIAPTAVAWCRRRFPASSVEYVVADVLAPPAAWAGLFDLVVEAYTLQVLPPGARQSALERIARFVAPGGTLLLIARGREPEDDPGAMPWPLTRAELDPFNQHGLTQIRFDDYADPDEPSVRRFRVEYRAAGAGAGRPGSGDARAAPPGSVETTG